MGIIKYTILFCLTCSSRAVGEISKGCTSDTRKGFFSPLSQSSTRNGRAYRSSINRFVEKLFDETDTDGDGMVSLEEAYVGCLLLYVQLNRQAPIPPPSREKFLRIFLQAADKNQSNKVYKLDKTEYRNVLKKIVKRAVLRLTSHKIVTLIGAPLLAEIIVRGIASRMDGFEASMRYIVPRKYHGTVIPAITSKAFLRGFWVVILVVTLGNISLAAVTLLLDMSLPKTQSQVHS